MYKKLYSSHTFSGYLRFKKNICKKINPKIKIVKTEDKPQAEIKIKSKKSRFFQGILLSALNVFPIPYYAYMSITIASFGWMDFEKTSIISYVAGATMGSFVTFYIYIFFFDKIKSKTLTSQKSMNYLIGIVTGVISIMTLVNIIKEM